MTLEEARKYIRKTHGEIGGDAFIRPAGSLYPKYAVHLGRRITGQGNTLEFAIRDAEQQLAERPELAL